MRAVVFGAAVVVLAGGVHAQTLESTSTWTSGVGANGHTYRLYSVSPPVTWEVAQANAVALGGYLATITSANENAFVYSSLAIGSNNNVWHVDSFNSQIGPWLGGFKNPATGNYEWVTGEAFAYTSWSPGEPNNSGGTENRVHYFGNPGRSSNWNDITNTVPIEGYVVELVPAPASLSLLGASVLVVARRRRR